MAKLFTILMNTGPACLVYLQAHKFGIQERLPKDPRDSTDNTVRIIIFVNTDAEVFRESLTEESRGASHALRCTAARQSAGSLCDERFASVTIIGLFTIFCISILHLLQARFLIVILIFQHDPGAFTSQACSEICLPVLKDGFFLLSEI